MKANIQKFQEGGEIAPFVGYTPFFQPMGATQQGGSSGGKSSGSSKEDSSQKQLKDIIGQIAGKGLTNEVNIFSDQVGQLFADNDLLGQPVSVRQYTSLVSRLNEIQNNKQVFEEARKHALEKGTLSEAAIDYSGGLYAQDKEGRLVMINPFQYEENRDNYRLLTNNDLLTLRNTSNAYAFDNSLSQTVSGSLSINDINKNIQEVVKSIGVEKESSDYYFDKAKANQLQKGLQAIVSEKLNTAPDMTYKVTEEVATQRNNINMALNYIWNNLNQQSKNTLIARAAINNQGDPQKNAIESIKDILVFGTDHAHIQTIKDENIEGKSGKGSKGGGMTDINPLLSYVSDPKNQDYTIKLGGDYGFKVKASVRPFIGAKGEVLNENYLSDAITSGGLGSMVDVAGASVGTGKPLNVNDLSKIVYEGDRVAMSWLPYVEDKSIGSKVVDIDALNRIETAEDQIASLGDNATEDQKMMIYRNNNVDHLILHNNQPTSAQLAYMHQFLVVPSLIPEEVAEKVGLDNISNKLGKDQAEQAREMYARIRSRLDNKIMRSNSYAPDEGWFFDDDIYKSSIFLPVQDELTSTFFTGKTPVQTSKDNMSYENVIRNVNQVTQRKMGLNPDAFK